MAFTARTETYVELGSLTTPFDITVTKPTGTVDGDILFCWIGWYGSGVTIDSAPSGWTLLGDYTANLDRYALYYKIASGEGASWVWSFSATCQVRAVCSCYTGGDFNPSDPIDVVSNTSYRTFDLNCLAASMIVAAVNSPLVFWGGARSGVDKTFTKPSVPTSDWVEDDDAGGVLSTFWVEVCSMIWSGSGATGDMIATISASVSLKHAFAVALNPPAATTAFLDISTRFKLFARNFKDIPTRFRLWGRSFADTATRFKLLVQNFTDATTRFKLWAQQFQDIQSRFRLEIRNFTDIPTRFKVIAQRYLDTATRFLLIARGHIDIGSRFKLTVQSFQDIATRFRLRTVQNYRDIATRFRLHAQSYADIATRFKLAVQNFTDIATRFRLIVQSFVDVATRFRLVSYAYRDTSTRFFLYVPTWKELQIQAELAGLQAQVDALSGQAHFRT